MVGQFRKQLSAPGGFKQKKDSAQPHVRLGISQLLLERIDFQLLLGGEVVGELVDLVQNRLALLGRQPDFVGPQLLHHRFLGKRGHVRGGLGKCVPGQAKQRHQQQDHRFHGSSLAWKRGALPGPPLKCSQNYNSCQPALSRRVFFSAPAAAAIAAAPIAHSVVDRTGFCSAGPVA